LSVPSLSRGVFRSLVAAAFAVVLSLVTTTNAWAADDKPADLVERGIELRTQNKDDEALALFRRAYGMAPEPRTRAQIGLAEQALGQWVAAEADLEAALSSKGTDAWIAKNAHAIEGALTTIRSHLGSIEARTNAEAGTANLVIDGVTIGKLPLAKPARATLGTHRLEVKAPGYASSARTVEIATAGAVLRENFELAREAAANGGSGRNNNNNNGGNNQIGDGPTTPPIITTPGATQRTLGWVMLGVGLGVGAFAGVSFALHDGQVRAYNDDASCPGRSSTTQPPNCADKIDSADRWMTIGIVSAVGGGILAASGLIVLLTAPSASSRVACNVHGCSVRF
jgi:hypothetical protein